MVEHSKRPGGCEAEPFENADLVRDRSFHTKSLGRIQSDLTDPMLTEMAAAIRAEHLAVRGGYGLAVEHAIKAGQLLNEAKAKLPHGQWLPWLDKNCEIGERMAQNYMRLARNLSKLPPSKTKSLSDLTLTKALAQLGHQSRLPMKVRPANAALNPADAHNELVLEKEGRVLPGAAASTKVVELRPEPVTSQAITRPDDPEPEMFFEEDDEGLRRARNMWRIRYQELIAATLTLEDANWALEMLHWHIRNGHRS